MMIDLTAKPFYLTEEQIKWVEETKGSMTIEEKIGQLFLIVGVTEEQNYLNSLLSIKPGGVMFRPLKKAAITEAHKYLQTNSKVPLFLAANLEAGANGLVLEGNRPGNNMTIAATDDPKYGYAQGEISITEAFEVGGNMAFAPVIDINYNFENPITNVRSYGDDVDRIIKMSKAFVDGVQENGGSVTIKHFPGDGCDGRDQHVVRTANSLSWTDWQNTYGRIYQENIDNGATGMMVGHISLASYFEENEITEEPSTIPASLSKCLINDVVRGKYGFNGLIMTDATLMAGFAQYGPRSEIVPMAIANGNDMFLFTKNLEEDYEFMMAGYQNGIITDERLDEALTRILGLKAKQELNDESKLFRPLEDGKFEEHVETCKEIADRVITLVKDDQGLLPLTTDKKIGLIDFTGSTKEKLTDTITSFKQELIDKGFEVEILKLDAGMDDPEEFVRMSQMRMSDFKQLADVFVYVAQKGPASNQTTIRISYSSFIGLDSPWFVSEVPTMYVSFGNPYHGYDWQDVPTGINCYDDSPQMITSAVEKLLTNEFTGVSPVKLDFKPFTGELD